MLFCHLRIVLQNNIKNTINYRLCDWREFSIEEIKKASLTNHGLCTEIICTPHEDTKRKRIIYDEPDEQKEESEKKKKEQRKWRKEERNALGKRSGRCPIDVRFTARQWFVDFFCVPRIFPGRSPITIVFQMRKSLCHYRVWSRMRSDQLFTRLCIIKLLRTLSHISPSPFP